MSAVVEWIRESHAAVHRWLDPSLESAGLPRWIIPVGAGLLVGGVYIYRNPALVLKAGIKFALYKAGFTVKCVKGKKFTYCYAERGKLRSDQPTMLFISGFGGSKVDWCDFTKDLQQDMHIILLDLPGQGGSTIPSDPIDIDLYVMRDNIAEFAFLLNLEVVGIHMIGISMGGSLAGLLAAKYPRLVNRATLLCPAMTCPIETEIFQTPDETAKVMKCGNVKKYREFMENMLSNCPSLPKNDWAWKGMMQMAEDNREYIDKLTEVTKQCFITDSRKYEETLSTIQVPTQIIWGENDQIVHVSGASMLEELIPGVKRVDLLPCGHMIPMDMPEQTRSLIMDFYNTTYST